MALFDDRRFLLSHINHSFITGDDTGICEVVMLDEDVFENQHQICLKLLGQNEQKPEDRLDPEAYDLNYESELFESEQGQSYDIASDLDYICHRRRSNTAQRLDRLKKDKINQSKTRTIVWRCNSPTSSHSEERLSHGSPTDELIGATATIYENGTPTTNNDKKSRSPPKKSGLTRLLEKFPSLPKNPFSEYAQFDGGMSEAVRVKEIMIFIALNQIQQQQTLNDMQQNSKTDNSNETNHNQSINSSGIGTTDGSIRDVTQNAPNAIGNPNTSTTNNNINANPQSSTNSQQQQPTSPSKTKNNGPLEVVIVSTAKVQDLIGLICWQYTNEGREPKLHQDINRYCLRIAEDNGEVDPDFTSLNPTETLNKFNFPSLALTEKTEERVRTYNEHQYTNGSIYNHRPPQVTSGVRISNASSRFATALQRIIFRDAKLDVNK